MPITLEDIYRTRRIAPESGYKPPISRPFQTDYELTPEQQQQYEDLYKELSTPKRRGFLPEFGRGLVSGAVGIPETAGTIVRYIGERAEAPDLVEAGEAIEDYFKAIGEPYAPPPEIASKTLWDNPELLANAAWWGYNLGNILPSFAAALIPAGVAGKAIQVAGNTYKWAPATIEKLATLGKYIAGGTVGGVLEAGPVYRDILDRGGTEQEAARSAELMAAGAGVLNAIGVERVLSKAGNRFKSRLMNRVVQRFGAGAWEGTTEAAEEPTEVFSRYIGKYLSGEPISENIVDDLAQSLKQGITVLPIAAVMGVGGSYLSGPLDAETQEGKSNRVITEDELSDELDDATREAFDAEPGEDRKSATQRLIQAKYFQERLKGPERAIPTEPEPTELERRVAYERRTAAERIRGAAAFEEEERARLEAETAGIAAAAYGTAAAEKVREGIKRPPPAPIPEFAKLPGKPTEIEGRPITSEERMVVTPKPSLELREETFLEKAQRRVGGIPGIKEKRVREEALIEKERDYGEKLVDRAVPRTKREEARSFVRDRIEEGNSAEESAFVFLHDMLMEEKRNETFDRFKKSPAGRKALKEALRLEEILSRRKTFGPRLPKPIKTGYLRERLGITPKPTEIVPKRVPEAKEEVKPEERVKEPWEMTSEEFGNAVFATELSLTKEKFPEYRKYAELKKQDIFEDAKKLFGPSAKKARLEEIEKQEGIAKAELETTLGEGAFEKLTKSHKEQVQQAVQKGKPVPREVLEDYRGEPWADEALKAKKPTVGKVTIPEPKAIATQLGDIHFDGKTDMGYGWTIIKGLGEKSSFLTKTPELAEVTAARDRIREGYKVEEKPEVAPEKEEKQLPIIKWGKAKEPETYKRKVTGHSAFGRLLRESKEIAYIDKPYKHKEPVYLHKGKLIRISEMISYSNDRYVHTVKPEQYGEAFHWKQTKLAREIAPKFGAIITEEKTPEYEKKKQWAEATGLRKPPKLIKQIIKQPPTKARIEETLPTELQTKNLIRTARLVKTWLKQSGLPKAAIDNITLELKPVLDLKGRDLTKTLEDWRKEGKTPKTLLGATTFDGFHATVELALNVQNLNELEKTTYHEAFHVATKWLLPESDYAAIQKYFKSDEGMADAFADYVQKGSQAITGKPFNVRTLFRKLKAALQRIGRKLTGIKTPEDVFGKIVRGKYPLKPEIVKRETFLRVEDLESDYQEKFIAFDPKGTKWDAEGLKNIAAKTYAKFVYENYPALRVAKKAGKSSVERLESLFRRQRGKAGIVEDILAGKGPSEMLDDGTIKYKGTKSLKEILSPLKTKEEYRDYETMRVAERDIALSLFRPKIKGLTSDLSRTELDRLTGKYGEEGMKKFREISKQHRQFEREVILEPLVKIGWMKPEDFDKIVNAPEYEYYASFMREMAEHESHILGTRSPIKHIYGSTRRKIPSVEATIANVQRTINLITQQKVAKAFVELRNVNKELAELIKEVKPAIQTVEKTFTVKRAKPSQGIPAETITRKVSVPFAPRDAITIGYEGKKKYFRVPPDIRPLLDKFGGNEVSTVVKLISVPARILRAGATLSTEFMARNPVRDQFTAFVYTKYGYIPGWDFAKGMFHLLKKTDLYSEYKAAGAEQSYFTSLDRQTINLTARDIAGYKKKGKERFRTWNPIEALRILSETTEKATRLGVYGKARKKGATPLEATGEAREGGLDFRRIGQERALNQVIAFWNANVQGTDKMVRAFKTAPTRTLTKVLAGITMPSILLWLLNHDDDRYKALPQWQKNFFWIIPVGKDGPIIRIPKPFELGIIFGSLPERILDYIYLNDSKELKTIGKALKDGAFPGLIPTAALPIIEHITNYSFFRERPLETEGVKQRPKELRYTPYTTETAKALGKIINVSPVKIENWIRVWGGTLGASLVQSMDYLYEDDVPRVGKHWYETAPAVKGFVAREPIGAASKYVEQFYDILEKTTEAGAGYKILSKTNRKEAIKFKKNRQKDLRYRLIATKIARTLSKLRKARDSIVDRKNMSSEDKQVLVRKYNKRISDLAQRFVERYYNQ